MQLKPETISWLLRGDPAVCWQVERDLLGSSPRAYQATRNRVAKEGWGKRLLDCQDPGGTWGGGYYSPKWTSTHYTLLTLCGLGLPAENAQARKGCQQLLDRGFYEPDGGMNFSASYDYSETCITGMTLNILSYFKVPDRRLDQLVEHLLGQQMADGGWNCESFRGATHSSFHTTISVLEGLLSFQHNLRNDSAISSVRERAHEFLLQHRLFRSHRAGMVVDPRMTRFPFPPRWFYDVLRGLDYFQLARSTRDDRFRDAIELLKKKQNKDLTWRQYRGMSGRIYFELEPAGEPGRMNTLRAYRVMKWWEGI